jgi:hypothetical protein
MPHLSGCVPKVAVETSVGSQSLPVRTAALARATEKPDTVGEGIYF